MKNIINKGSILAFILVLACFVSCNDSYLEEKPMDKFSPENLLTSKAGFETVIVSLHSYARDEANLSTMMNR